MTASEVSIRRCVKFSNIPLLSYSFCMPASAARNRRSLQAWHAPAGSCRRNSPGAAFPIVDMDDAVSVDLEASHFWAGPEIGHHATGAGPHPEVDGPAGQMQGLAGAAGTPIASPAAMGGLDAD